MELDELDLRILQTLLDDPRTSFRSMAGDLGSSTPTVANRVRRMEALGIIAGYRTDVDPSYLPGNPFLVEATVQSPEGLPQHPEAETVMRLPGGRIAFTVRAQGHGLAELDAWCHEHGLRGVAISPILAFATGRRPIVRLEKIHLRCHHCRSPIAGEAVMDRIGNRTHAFCCPLCKDAFARRHAELATT